MIAQQSSVDRLFSCLGFGIILALALFACFPEVLLGRETFFAGRFGPVTGPDFTFLRDSVWRGELPLWNPLNHAGVPFFAQGHPMAAYPLALLCVLLPLPWSLGVFSILHLWIGGVGMYLLARRWNDQNFAAAFAGAAWVFNGIALSAFLRPNDLVALAWLPFVVHLAEQAWRESGRKIVAAAVVGALQLGSGAAEIILFTWLIVGVIWLVDLAEVRAFAGRMLWRLLCTVILAGALMAVQLLPFWDLFRDSREARVIPAAVQMPWWAAGNFFVPLANSFRGENGQFFQHGQSFFSSVYLGLGAVVFALMALFRMPHVRLWALAALGLLSVALAMGDQTPVWPALERVLPPDLWRPEPAGFVIIIAFLVPLIAASGVRVLMVGRGKHTGGLTTTVLLVLAVMAAVLWYSREHALINFSAWPEQVRLGTWAAWEDAARNAAVRAGLLVLTAFCVLAAARSPAGTGAFFGCIAMAAIVFDARTHVPNQNPTVAVSELTSPIWSDTAGPPPQLGHARVLGALPAARTNETLVVTNALELWRSARREIRGNLNLIERIPKVDGAPVLLSREQAGLQRALAVQTNIAPGILDLLGVAWVSARDGAGRWERRDTHLPLVTAGQEVARADRGTILPRLLSDEFNPREVVFIESHLAATNPATISVLSQSAAGNRVEFEVDAAGEGIALIAQSFHRGWRARVQDRPVPVWRANVAFQAISVPAGRHRVVMTYTEPRLRMGALISAAALVLCAVIWIASRRPVPR